MTIDPRNSQRSTVSSGITSREPVTPKARPDSHLMIPIISPVPGYRLSPALDEFSLRRTPSRGGTASPAPAKGVRKRLHQYRNLDHAVDLLRQSRNVVVLTGAGISTSVGIPDFRSDKGLYSQLSKDLGITEAEEFFSRDYFVHNTAQFLQYVKRVIPEAVLGPDGYYRSVNSVTSMKDGKTPVPEFSLTHAFLALLQLKRKLLTNYTQNIDGLEIAAGVPRAKLIQCHGSWDTASCMTCGRSSAAKKYLPVVFGGNIPFCKCKLEAEQKSRKGSKIKAGKKRSRADFDSDHSSDDGTQAPRGLLKPDITFFNERLSGSFGNRLDEDKRKIDLLIIIGTSLKVGPVQDMLYQISAKVPQIFISRERFSGALCNLPGVQVDIELLGECDTIIEEICRRAGWSNDLDSLCWKPGQTRIRQFDRTTSTPSDSLRDDDVTDSDSLEPQALRSKSTKRRKIGDTAAGIDRSSHGNRENLRRVAKRHGLSSAMTPDDTTDHATPLKHQDQDRFSVRQSHLERDNKSTTSSTVAVEYRSKFDADPHSIGSTKSTDGHVKIELVEGTAHQWRITRK